jgi:hypothetical protein
METLLSQFDSNVYKKDGSNGPPPDTVSAESDTKATKEGNAKVGPADLAIVKEIRQNIMDVLGPDISPYTHEPPQEMQPRDEEENTTAGASESQLLLRLRRL